VDGLAQTLRGLGVMRLIVLAVVGAAMIAFFAFLTTRLTTPPLALLYSDLELRDSGQIVQKLDSMGIVYQIKGDGSQILVPSDQVARLRMVMAETGLPHAGSIGYEIFDKTDALGTSSLVQDINHVRALEGELARTISSLTPVHSARVHIVLPRREMFSRERQEPSASIVIKMRGADRLSHQQVAAVQHLVAAAIPGLKPGRVSIVDSDGTLLASGDSDTSAASATSSNAEEMRVNYETRLARNVEELIERSVGPGKARADVHADMDFDKITTNSESYDPDGQVVRSTQEVNDSSENNDAGDQPVTVTTNLPNAQATPGTAGGKSKTAHEEKTTNYDITKTVRNQVREAGVVRRLSVAVLVDGNYTAAADGTRSYEPRSADELKQLTALVHSAIGFDEKRGDTVDVVNLRFAAPPEVAPPPVTTVFGFERAELLHVGEMLVVALVAVLFILLVVRPLLMRMVESGGDQGGQLTREAPAGTTALPAPGGGSSLVPAAAGGNGDHMIDLGQVEGRVAASSIRKIGEIVEKHPDEAVSIVRSWMSS
jgi:flagellar M-ring protein FliF